jgi:hypothetical protein
MTLSEDLDRALGNDIWSDSRLDGIWGLDGAPIGNRGWLPPIPQEKKKPKKKRLNIFRRIKGYILRKRGGKK